jgi:hypothetical protein
MKTIRAILWFVRRLPRYWADARCAEMEARWDRFAERCLTPEQRSASQAWVDEEEILLEILDGDDMD